MLRQVARRLRGLVVAQKSASPQKYSRAVVNRGGLMACLRWLVPDAGWRRYSYTLMLLMVTNLLTGFIMYTRRDNTWAMQPLHYTYGRNCSQLYSLNRPDYPYLSRFGNTTSPSLPTIFVITPTHACDTQKVDLTSLCHTLSLVPKLVWIVIEDSAKQTKLVTHLLKQCMVESVHLNIATSAKYKSSLPWPLYRIWGTIRGVEQRNAGLRWLKENKHPRKSSGVLYFADDDNKFDLRVFSEIRKTKNVSVFKVGFAGGLLYEGPVCDKNGRVKEWHSASAEWSLLTTQRKMPIDMAGFAVNLRLLLARPDVWIGKDPQGRDTKVGQLETNFLEHFTTREKVECRGLNSEVLVWHTKTADPNLKHEWHYPSDSDTVLYR